MRLTRLLRSGFFGGMRVGDEDGYLSTIGGRILNSEAEVCTLGLGHLSEVVIHRRPLGGSFAGMVQSGSIPVTGEFGQWTCSNCAKPACWSTPVSLLQVWVSSLFWCSRARASALRVKGLWDEWRQVGGCSWSEIKRMFRLGIPRTGKAVVGEEEPGRHRCLLLGLALVLEEAG